MESGDASPTTSQTTETRRAEMHVEAEESFFEESFFETEDISGSPSSK